ncbi:hypothetical protein ACOMHN_031577 [Nucella lapillus]
MGAERIREVSWDTRRVTGWRDLEQCTFLPYLQHVLFLREGTTGLFIRSGVENWECQYKPRAQLPVRLWHSLPVRLWHSLPVRLAQPASETVAQPADIQLTPLSGNLVMYGARSLRHNDLINFQLQLPQGLTSEPEKATYLLRSTAMSLLIDRRRHPHRPSCVGFHSLWRWVGGAGNGEEVKGVKAFNSLCKEPFKLPWKEWRHSTHSAKSPSSFRGRSGGIQLTLQRALHRWKEWRRSTHSAKSPSSFRGRSGGIQLTLQRALQASVEGVEAFNSLCKEPFIGGRSGGIQLTLQRALQASVEGVEAFNSLCKEPFKLPKRPWFIANEVLQN